MMLKIYVKINSSTILSSFFQQFLTSSKNRTIESAKSFIQGAFPDETIQLGAPNDTFLRVTSSIIVFISLSLNQKGHVIWPG